MNKQETEIFFALIRNALWGTPLSPSSWTGKWTWGVLLSEVEAHALQSLLANPILSLPESCRPDTQSQNRLTQLVALNMRAHVRLNADISRLFAAMRQENIHPILMKGQSLAGYYPNPMFRKCGDVDIYVGKGDMERVSVLLENMGAKRLEGCEKHESFLWGQTEVEAHRYTEIVSPPQCDTVYQRLVGEYASLCGTVSVGGMEVDVFPAQFLPLYLCCHIWHHIKSEGIGFRQFCDWALVLGRESSRLDVDRLKSDLESVGLLREWRALGGVLVKRLGLPSESFPLYEEMSDRKVECMTRLILEDGNFSVKHDWRNPDEPFLSRKLRSFRIHTRRFGLLARVSLPLFIRTYLSWMKIRLSKFLKGK